DSQLDGHRPVRRLALPQGVPREPQLAQAVDVGPRLVGEQRAAVRRAVGGADAEDALATPQLAHPMAVGVEVAVAGMAQAARVRVDDAQRRQAPVLLSHDTAGERLAAAAEADVGDARVRFGAGGQRRQDDSLARLAQTEQYPTGFLVAVDL